MYAFIVKSHWDYYLNNTLKHKSTYSIDDAMNFLAVVGTPCVLENEPKTNENLYNGVRGYYQKVKNGSAIKYIPTLVNDDLNTKLSKLIIG